MSDDTDATASWELTVFYTPVETFHGGTREEIFDSDGRSLGFHSADFLEKVATEGYGRLSTPVDGRDYLRPDGDSWALDDAARGADGAPLMSWRSAAADPGMPFGTRLRITHCGKEPDGTEIDPSVCSKVRESRWVVADRGSAITGRHLDLYYGEEDRGDFEGPSNPFVFDVVGATVVIQN